MAFYRNKSREIEAIEFTDQTRFPEGVTIQLQSSGYEVYNQLHNSWIKLKPGDFVRIDKAPEDVYPIDRETFFNTYELRPMYPEETK